VLRRNPKLVKKGGLRFLLLRLSLTPEVENAFAQPEKAQAVKEEAQHTEIPQEYRVARRESNPDQDHACNDAFHKFVNRTALTAFRMPIKAHAAPPAAAAIPCVAAQWYILTKFISAATSGKILSLKLTVQ
jgi:hypothetical protein